MEQNESVQLFLRLLGEKHEQYKTKMNSLLAALVEENNEVKKEYAMEFYNSAKELRAVLSSQDSPNWLSISLNAIDSFLKNIGNYGVNITLLKIVLTIYNQAFSYQWKFEDPQKISAIDFDSIYEKCKSESHVDILFDDIICYLRKIIDSGDIDSIKIKSTLETLIATLDKHSTASYFSIHSMWDFISQLMKNILWEELEKIPGISGIIKGLRKTIEQTGIELNDLREKMKNEMLQKYASEFPFLNKSPQNLLEYYLNKKTSN